jgi:hypothetical protein
VAKTDLFEGTIIRAMRRLDELLGQARALSLRLALSPRRPGPAGRPSARKARLLLLRWLAVWQVG